MNVAFWSGSHENGVTSCAIVTGVICANLYDFEVTYYDNHVCPGSIARVLFRNRWDSYLEAARRSTVRYGREYGFRQLARYTDKDISAERRLELKKGRLWLDLHGIFDPEGLYREQNFMHRFIRENHLQFAPNDSERTCGAINLIDTECSRNSSTVEVLDCADLVVVMLPQTPAEIRLFFLQFNSIVNKSVFVLNRTNPYNHYRISDFCRDYRINPGRVVEIPFSKSYKIADAEGKVQDFLMQNLCVEAGKAEHDFLRAYMVLADFIGNTYGEGIRRECNNAKEKKKSDNHDIRGSTDCCVSGSTCDRCFS